ncbi:MULTISPECIES: aspartyl-phosphate phosphatase Spo0E family protein [Bacillales]|uniref:Aspartyl-phosphate phosphatase Spo0E family protein n=1 Tax=Lysinibacillus louembei TaxID=1470088 RepID=A0ABZ0RX70_9BACI|nr:MULTISPECIES: aspartyl-phosphate phosphatase Spo0E family protein [Bacillales]MCT6922577.1 aspartyl-phosphate phosphatase Spo0E family protein [Metasolibacillus sp.]MCT6939084.1 aspartyl-phosphate phosphatase Spo0E family protein [Metasolibacillus sp.]WPK11528.1 aspartyl-phosphate phosphatase Spo0E family protein [Lysinibacillus louembei]
MLKHFFQKIILKCRIEFKRKQMYKIAKDLGYTHPKVVESSQQLDTLLNSYSK